MPESEEVTMSAVYRAVAVTFKTLVKKSKAMKELCAKAERISSSNVNVLLLGETGTGKNLIAQAIHNASPRAGGPFVSINCSAIPDSLLESELFGSEEGAFTDATRTRKGRFELADGGTLFLDEIGDLSPQAQAKILHAIEYKEFTRVGGEKTLTSDVRLIAATNLPLDQHVEEGRFRQDLYYRLNEVELRIPALRERPEEIPELLNHFIEECNQKYDRKVKKVDKETLKLLQAHEWPGNVRELRGVVKRGVANAAKDVLTMDDLSLKLRLVDADNTKVDGSQDLSLAYVERKHIEAVLNYTGWVKTEAARLLGVSRPTLDRKIESYGLKKAE